MGDRERAINIGVEWGWGGGGGGSDRTCFQLSPFPQFFFFLQTKKGENGQGISSAFLGVHAKRYTHEGSIYRTSMEKSFLPWGTTGKQGGGE